MNQKKIPDWELQPLGEFSNNLKLLYDNFSQFVNTIKFNSDLPEFQENLNKIVVLLEMEDDLLNVENAKEISEIAKKEIKNDYSFIHGQWSILLYVNLEALVKKIVINNLKNTDYLHLKEFEKMKLETFDNLEAEYKYDSIYRKYELKITSGLNYGHERFLTILKPFGYCWESSEQSVRKLSELAQVRNILLHKNGHSDKMIVERCPWLDLKYGQKIIITREMFLDYLKAVKDFVMKLKSVIDTKYTKVNH